MDIVTMLTAKELKRLAQRTNNARLRTRYLAVYHFTSGHNRTEIAKMLSASRTSVNAWVSAYLSEGLDGLQSGKSTGRPKLLSEKQVQQVKRYVESHGAKPDGGRLVAEDIRQYIEDSFGIKYGTNSIYRVLYSMGLSWITSRSHHPKRDEKAQELFKKPATGNDPSHTRECGARSG